MKTLSNLFRALKELPAKYPAVISGYIIYLYLFIVMIRFFVVAHAKTITFYDVIEMFDALPFMWLLAMMLVKVINMRTKLYESETQRIMHEQELHIKETQISTMREVVLGLQHQINNPLAIIMFLIHKLRRSVPMSDDVITQVNSIETESQRIAQALKDFSASQQYEVEQIGKSIGTMAIPSKTS